MEKELEWERKVKVKLQGWASEREKIKYRDVKCKIYNTQINNPWDPLTRTPRNDYRRSTGCCESGILIYSRDPNQNLLAEPIFARHVDHFRLGCW